MASFLDSAALVVTAYAAAAAVCVALGLRERRAKRHDTDLLPTFWLLSGLVLAVMAVGQTGNLGSAIAALGRQSAHREGWYDSRRPVQAAVAGAIGVGWLLVVAVAIWRVPARRRRYLPVSLALLTLCCYSMVRLISLHQIDAIVYRRSLAGVRVGVVVDLVLVSLVVVLTAVQFHLPRPNPQTRAGDPTPRRSPATSTLAPPSPVE